MNIVASVNLTDKSQTLKVDRKLGIKDTTCDKLCVSLTDAITIIHALGTHEFAVKFKPGVLYSLLKRQRVTRCTLPLQGTITLRSQVIFIMN